MNNLKIREFNESHLKRAIPITDGNGYFKTYDLNNGNIMKVVKSVGECLKQPNCNFLLSGYNYFISEIYDKLSASKDIETKSIVLPNAVFFSGDIPIAYTVPKLEGYVNLIEFLFNSYDLDLISSVFIDLTKEVRHANKEGIIIPDLGNASNILINPKTKDIKFIDYDGMQIGKYQSFVVSSLVRDSILPITRNSDMIDFKTDLLKNNIDKYSLMLLYIFFTTKCSIKEFLPSDYHFKDGKFVLKKDALTKYIESVGLDETPLENDLYRLIYEHKFKYPDTSIKQLTKKHKLEMKSNTGLFIKK